MAIAVVPQPSRLVPPSEEAPAVQTLDRALEWQLVCDCQAGDRSAWRRLYDGHFAMVDRLVRSVGIRDAEADDLCQEIFLLVYRYLHRFRGDARLSTWIYRLTVRESIRFAKRRRRRAALAKLFAAEHMATAGPEAGWDNTAGRRRYLEQLLATLPPERRMALVLFEVEGLPVGDIARLMGCKENTVWTRLHRARTDIQNHLGAEEAKQRGDQEAGREPIDEERAR